MVKGVVFFDLDGTLLNKQSQLDQQNREALKRLQANDYLPVIVSGRAPWEIEAMMAGTSVDTYVGLNGQIVVDKKPIYQADISQEVIDQVVMLSLNLGHSLAFYGSQTNRITFVDDAAIKLYELDNAEIPQVQPDFYKKESILMLYLFSEQVEKDASYHSLFKDYLTIVRDSPYSIAMTAVGNSKKSGIKRLLAHLAISKDVPTYAFGDGNNDLPMFEIADHRIAMENGTIEIKQAADFITKSNTENGIVYGLEHFHLI